MCWEGGRGGGGGGGGGGGREEVGGEYVQPSLHYWVFIVATVKPAIFIMAATPGPALCTVT